MDYKSDHDSAVLSEDKMDVYDVSKSMTSRKQMREWLRAKVTEDITQIPGVGKKNATILATPNETNEFVSTAHQLLGVYLYSKMAGINSQEQCNRFYTWLKRKGVYLRAHDIVQACSEKCKQVIQFSGQMDILVVREEVLRINFYFSVISAQQPLSPSNSSLGENE